MAIRRNTVFSANWTTGDKLVKASGLMEASTIALFCSRFRRGRRIGRLACHRRAGCLRAARRRAQWRDLFYPEVVAALSSDNPAVVGGDDA